jgi:hypothetical protein
MNPCESLEEPVIFFGIEELDSSEHERVEAHTRDCTACRTRLERVRAIHQALERFLPELPKDQRTVPRGAILARRKTWSAHGLGWARLGVAAALLLAVFVTWRIMQFAPKDQAAISPEKTSHDSAVVDEKVVLNLIRRLTAEEPGIGEEAFRKLRQMGSAVVPILERELVGPHDPDTVSRIRALLDALAQVSLEKIGERAFGKKIPEIDGAVWRPDGRQVAIGSRFGTFGIASVILDATTWQEVFEVPGGDPSALRYSPQGKCFAVLKTSEESSLSNISFYDSRSYRILSVL